MLSLADLFNERPFSPASILAEVSIATIKAGEKVPKADETPPAAAAADRRRRRRVAARVATSGIEPTEGG